MVVLRFFCFRGVTVHETTKPLAASQSGAFRGPEIDQEHSRHISNHTVSLWGVPLIFQRLVVIGGDGLGAQKKKKNREC